MATILQQIGQVDSEDYKIPTRIDFGSHAERYQLAFRRCTLEV